MSLTCIHTLTQRSVPAECAHLGCASSAEVKADRLVPTVCHKATIAPASLTALFTVSSHLCDVSLGQRFIFLRGLSDERFLRFFIFCSELSKIMLKTFLFLCVTGPCVHVTAQGRGPTLKGPRYPIHHSNLCCGAADGHAMPRD